MHAATRNAATRRSTVRARTATRPSRQRRRGGSKHRAAGAAGEAAASLGRYVDAVGRTRELVRVPAAGGSVLVVDRDALTLRSGRLVAHLAADEPPANARVVCDQYLADPTRGRCRPLAAVDLEAAPPAYEPDCDDMSRPPLVDDRGARFRLELAPGARSVPDLRWVCARRGRAVPLSLRAVIARLQSYEPARALTRAALAESRDQPGRSLTVLRGELERVDSSPIVLNRGLREAVLESMRREGISASEIAIRCGRTKVDERGNVAGETSWLARRVGLAPEGGAEEPTPWIHSDVLALIARRGLGLSPREVELG